MIAVFATTGCMSEVLDSGIVAGASAGRAFLAVGSSFRADAGIAGGENALGPGRQPPG